MDPDSFKTFLEWVMREEQFTAKAQWDVKGWTVGFGRHGAERGITKYTVTTVEEATTWCVDDLIERYKGCAELLGWKVWNALSPVRQGCLTAMAYQMGVEKVAGFKRMLTAIFAGDFNEAANEMIDSIWARDETPDRARRTAKAFREDAWPDPDTLPEINWETEVKN